MGLSKPGWFSNTATDNNSKNYVRIISRVAATIIIVGVVILVVLGIYRHFHPKAKIVIVNANDSLIQQKINSQNVDDKRTLVSAYEAKGDYNNELLVAQAIASQTKQYQDYLSVLQICTLYDVPQKQSCISEAAKNLKPSVATMAFSDAYSAGAMLEKDGDKKDAVDFYQRAYDIYSPVPHGDNSMTKDQLKAHIDELRK